VFGAETCHEIGATMHARGGGIFTFHHMSMKIALRTHKLTAIFVMEAWIVDGRIISHHTVIGFIGIFLIKYARIGYCRA